MKKIGILLFVSFLFPALAANACPVWKRHVANNGLYFEMGGGGLFLSSGYALALNGGYFYQYYVDVHLGYVTAPASMHPGKPMGITTGAEFHGSFYQNSIWFWTSGLSWTRVEDRSIPETAFIATERSYLSPMVGIEALFGNRYGIEFKYQPYLRIGDPVNLENFTSLVGVKLKVLFGRVEDGGGGGMYW